MALDGFIAEFLLDKDNNMLLHGFWSTTTYKGELKAVPQDADQKVKLRQKPAKAYPYPVDKLPEKYYNEQRITICQEKEKENQGKDQLELPEKYYRYNNEQLSIKNVTKIMHFFRDLSTTRWVLLLLLGR